MWMFLRWGKDSGVRCSLLVCEDIVDVLDDVNLSAVRPVWSEHPKGRPRSATNRHMLYIRYEETLAFGNWSQLQVMGGVKIKDITKRYIATKANRCSSSSRIVGWWIDTKVDLTVCVTDQVRIFSSPLRNVADESIRWVGAGEERELVEEVGCIVLQNISLPWSAMHEAPPVNNDPSLNSTYSSGKSVWDYYSEERVQSCAQKHECLWRMHDFDDVDGKDCV